MKNLFLLMILTFGGILSAEARQTTPQPTPQNTPNQALERQREVDQQRDINARLNNLRNARNNNVDRFRNSSHSKNLPSYRKPNKKELEIVAPDSSDLQKFADFLKQPNTGLIKLVEDFGCTENSRIVVATEECLKYSIPDAGASYSFRIDNYRIRRLADLTFSKNSFQGLGVLAHSIFVNVGDVPLDKITLQTNGLKFLTDFKPETDFNKARELDMSLIYGIEKDGFAYGRGLPAVDNATYVLRSIAYRGVFTSSGGGWGYNELDYDKRKDIIVAFRIVNRNEAGIITILWKELDRKDSPKVKRTIKNSETGIKENKFIAEKSRN